MSTNAQPQATRCSLSVQVPRRAAVAREDRAKVFGARLVAILHNQLNGVASHLRGHRSPGYWRQQLRGEHPITIADLASLATHPAREARDAVRVFATALLDAVRPIANEQIEDATAAFTREAADVPAAVLRAQRDGRLTPDEVAEIEREAYEAGAHLERVRAALAGAPL